jgi:hypothetical protein
MPRVCGQGTGGGNATGENAGAAQKAARAGLWEETDLGSAGWGTR